ncbi:hypothetical protein BKA15_000534 [Microlunatus parietis]|uniref:Uncharacterized protein n=1 Tax=Microlunatus parietis TaxID=682979 RepID=A0A7Y9I370_9ACTN|nr:hypothetical protein [Microlunatus parietis]
MQLVACGDVESEQRSAELTCGPYSPGGIGPGSSVPMVRTTYRIRVYEPPHPSRAALGRRRGRGHRVSRVDQFTAAGPDAERTQRHPMANRPGRPGQRRTRLNRERTDRAGAAPAPHQHHNRPRATEDRQRRPTRCRKSLEAVAVEARRPADAAQHARGQGALVLLGHPRSRLRPQWHVGVGRLASGAQPARGQGTPVLVGSSSFEASPSVAHRRPLGSPTGAALPARGQGGLVSWVHPRSRLRPRRRVCVRRLASGAQRAHDQAL